MPDIKIISLSEFQNFEREAQNLLIGDLNSLRIGRLTLEEFTKRLRTLEKKAVSLSCICTPYFQEYRNFFETSFQRDDLGPIENELAHSKVSEAYGLTPRFCLIAGAEKLQIKVPSRFLRIKQPLCFSTFIIDGAPEPTWSKEVYFQYIADQFAALKEPGPIDNFLRTSAQKYYEQIRN